MYDCDPLCFSVVETPRIPEPGAAAFVHRVESSKPPSTTMLDPEMMAALSLAAAVLAVVWAVAALPMAVVALVEAVLAVERTEPATVWTSVGSLEVAPDEPFRPSQKFAQAS